ncbi:hypothetical protein [Streptomyces sp. NPDC012510]|uniref:hypothetical protein n=1 Tax=Streptomyces sp. NPDC012510 TaxID=3364838 RepID=UPI0036E07A15
MRNRTSRSRRVAAVGAVLAVALGTGVSGAASVRASASTSASAHGAEAALVVPCPFGFVCLAEGASGTGAHYRIAQGTAARFGVSVRVGEATNRTTVDYCVSGSFSYLLPAGETQTRDSLVRSVVPRPTGGTCPM